MRFLFFLVVLILLALWAAFFIRPHVREQQHVADRGLSR
jgi:hypothetical protein